MFASSPEFSCDSSLTDDMALIFSEVPSFMQLQCKLSFIPINGGAILETPFINGSTSEIPSCLGLATATAALGLDLDQHVAQVTFQIVRKLASIGQAEECIEALSDGRKTFSIDLSCFTESMNLEVCLCCIDFALQELSYCSPLMGPTRRLTCLSTSPCPLSPTASVFIRLAESDTFKLTVCRMETELFTRFLHRMMF